MILLTTGLPMAVTMSLTIIARAMKRQKVLCKGLSTVETLGCINVLCSDKTGTLTENRMQVISTSICGEEATPEIAHQFTQNDSPPWKQLWHVVALCCGAKFEAVSNDRPVAERLILGDATDQATLRFAETLSPVAPLLQAWKQVFEIPFNSKNKVKSLVYGFDTSSCFVFSRLK
jgi:sodium/potassium-transporting ATPase subunit alpha